jgi:hypothetical protein
LAYNHRYYYPLISITDEDVITLLVFVHLIRFTYKEQLGVVLEKDGESEYPLISFVV